MGDETEHRGGDLASAPNIYDRLRRQWDAGHRDAVAMFLARNAYHALEFAEGLDPLDRIRLTQRIGDFEAMRERPLDSAQVRAWWAKGEGA